MGTIVWLSSELMFFAALFAMYFTIRSVSLGQGLPWPEAHLDVPFSTVNTIDPGPVECDLPAGRVGRGEGRRSRKLRFWYILSFLMGAIFVGGQLYEYCKLVARGAHSRRSTPTARSST